MSKQIKVLVVDDSAIVRNMLNDELNKQNDIEVIGTAPDPFYARDQIVRLKPDVITLDIEMPRMDGLTFLKKIMSYYPMPVIIVSSVTTNDKSATIKALELGAFDVVNKPGGSISVAEVIGDITFKIRQAYQIKDSYIQRRKSVMDKIQKAKPPKIPAKSEMLRSFTTTDKLIAIGASTGGTVALEFVLKHLPVNLPPIVITQHMPPNFTKQFADRLDEICDLHIKEAENGEMITNGSVYIAQGGQHLALSRRGANLYTNLTDTEREHFQKPAVDVMFRSVAENVGRNAVGILLTGMGKDGATGLKAMKENGARTYAQDEATSIVWGMPKEAVEIGAAMEQVPLQNVPLKIIEFAKS